MGLAMVARATGFVRSFAPRVMKVIINGAMSELPDGLTVRGLIEHLGLTSGPVAVERNREVVPRAVHTSTSLADGDVLELVHFVGGG